MCHEVKTNYEICNIRVLADTDIGSCADDKGNYDYQVINELDITGIETGIAYRKIAYVDTLKISPEVKTWSVPKDYIRMEVYPVECG